MNIFFCDIRGTINGNENDRNNQLFRLAKNLQIMCDTLNINELFFDFFSTEEMNTVLKYLKEIEPFIRDTSIKFGIQFSEKEKYNNGRIEKITANTKVAQMCSVLEDESVNRVILADDTVLNHKMLKHALGNRRPNIEMISLIPNTKTTIDDTFCSTKYGIEGLNESLESYIYALSTTCSRKRN